MNTWSIVKFSTDNSVEAVPTRWLSENECFWPHYTRDRLQKAIRNCEPPLPSWDTHKITAFRNATYDDYSIARKKCQRAEVTSDLNSEGEKRSIKKPSRLLSSSSSDISEDDSLELPQLPKITIKPSLNVNTRKEISSVQDNEKIKQNSSLSNVQHNTPELLCKCCPHHRYEDSTTGFIKQILRKVSLLELGVAEIRQNIELLEHAKREEYEIVNDPWENFNLPLIDSAAFKEFEEFLMIEENMKKSIRQLNKVGGDTPTEFTRRAMSKLMTNKLASDFSWVGLKKKEVFSKSKIAELVICAGQMNQKTKENSSKDFEEGIKKFLRRAKERHVAEEL